jgi:hypothetical protein
MARPRWFIPLCVSLSDGHYASPRKTNSIYRLTCTVCLRTEFQPRAVYALSKITSWKQTRSEGVAGRLYSASTTPTGIRRVRTTAQGMELVVEVGAHGRSQAVSWTEWYVLRSMQHG